jgi:hypothetical protein
MTHCLGTQNETMKRLFKFEQFTPSQIEAMSPDERIKRAREACDDAGALMLLSTLAMCGVLAILFFR